MKCKLIFCIIIIIILVVCMLTSCSQQENIIMDEVSSIEYSDLWLSPSFIQKNNEWFYYTGPLGGKIYKIKQNGMGKTEVDDLSANSFFFNDDYLYFTKVTEDKIYRYKLDDSEQTTLI